MAHAGSVPGDALAAPRAPKRLLALRGDDHLVAQVRGGSVAAFEVIYERYVPGILSFCRHMLGSLEEAEDAVQHTFAAAHHNLAHDGRVIRLKPWLYTVARNRCLSVLRARRDLPDEKAEPSIDGLDDEVQRRAELRELVADLQDLPEDQRAALVLSELRDLSHADVAEALDCQVAKVKRLVFRARSGLIERRDARGALCEEIRQELATARGRALGAARLRHHLRGCSACTDYLEEVRAQRKMLARILPVVPTVGLKQGVFASIGLGGGAGGGGAAGLLAAALPSSGATLAKVAVIGAVAGGAGVAGEATFDGLGPLPGPPPAVAPEGAKGVARAPSSAAASGDERSRSAARRRRAPRVEKRKKNRSAARSNPPAEHIRRGAAPTASVPAGPPQAARPKVPGLGNLGGRLPVPSERPELPSLPVRAEPPRLPSLPVRADPAVPPLPLPASPPEVPVCELSGQLCR